MKKIVLLIILFGCCINADASDTLDTKQWKQCFIKDANLKFYYPSFILQLDTTNNELNFSHSIHYKHPYPCNFTEVEMDSVNEITDLAFTIQSFKTNLKGVVKNILSDYFMKIYFSSDTLKTDEGFINKIKLGKQQWYKIEMGAEGCGQYLFVCPVNEKLTLQIRMPYASDCNFGLYNQWTNPDYLSLKGLMLPTQSQKIFYKILESIH